MNDESLSLRDLKLLESICVRFETAQSESDRDIGLLVESIKPQIRPYFIKELVALDFELKARNGDTAREVDYDSFANQSDAEIAKLALRQLKSESSINGKSDRIALPRRYQAQGRIGRGGLGCIWRVFDEQTKRTLAIKTLREDFRANRQANIRLQREALVTGWLQHPGVPPVHDVGQLDDGSAFFAMKLVDGQTLDEILHRSAKPELERILGIFQSVAQTLAYSHSQKIIHRDIKPANIMVGKFAEVQVMDWGMAKELGKDGAELRDADTEGKSQIGSSAETRTNSRDSSIEPSANLTRDGDLIGTPSYMSPEQARGELGQVDARADVYSLGAILFEILTGDRISDEPSAAQVVKKIASGDLVDALKKLKQCDADQQLVELCQRCLAVEADERPNDASEVADAMTTYFVNTQQRVKAVERELHEVEVRTQEELKRKRIVSRMLAVVAVSLALGLAGVIWQWTQTNTAKQLAEENSAKHLAAEELAKQRLRESQLLAGDFFTTVPTDSRLKRPELRDFRLELLNKSVAYQKDFIKNIDDSDGKWVAASAWKNLAIIQDEVNPSAKEVYESLDQAIALFQAAVDEAGSDVDEKLLLQFEDTYKRKANALTAESKFADAEAVYNLAIDLLKDRQSDAALSARAGAIGNLGYLYLTMRRIDDANQKLTQSARMSAEMAGDSEDVDSSGVRLSMYLNLAALNQDEIRNYDAAIEHATSGIEVGMAMLKKIPNSSKLKYTLARCYLVKAVSSQRKDREGDYRPLYEDALKITRELVANSDADPQSIYTHCLVCGSLAAAEIYAGDRGRAIELCTETTALLAELMKSHPTIANFTTAFIEQTRMFCYLNGMSNESTERYKTMLAAFQDYLKQNPNDNYRKRQYAMRLGALEREPNPELLELTDWIPTLKSVRLRQSFARILAYLRNGELENAKIWLENMSHKESGTATLLLSMFHLKEGREKKAKEYFEAATAFLKKRSEPPNDPPEYFQLLLAEELEELLDRVEK